MNQNRIEITQNDYVLDKFFNKGEVYDYIGMETVTEGCSCNGSNRSFNTYVVMMDNKKYNIKASKAGIKAPDTCQTI